MASKQAKTAQPTPKKPANRSRQAGASSDKGPRAGSGQRKLVGAGLVVIALLAAFLINRAAHQAIEARIPPLPDLHDKTESFRQALLAADRRARIAPGDEQGVGYLGLLYHANALHPEAGDCYQLAMEIEADEPRWPYYASLLRQNADNDDVVIGLLERTLELSADYAPAHLRLAEVLLKRDRLDEAAEHYQPYADDEKIAPYACLGLARIAISREDWGEAERQLLRATKAHPWFGVAHRLLSTVWGHQGRPEEAEAARARAETCGRFVPAPDAWMDELDFLCYDPEYLRSRADAARQSGMPERCMELLQRAVKVAPKSSAAHCGLADGLVQAGETEEARKHMLKAIELDPRNGEAHVGLGMILGREQRLDEAEEHFRKALAVNPADTSAYQGLGMTSRQRGDEAGAARHFLAACEASDFRFDEALEQYVGSLVRTNQQDEALKVIDAVLEVRPTAGPVWLLAFRVHQSRDDHAQAIATLKRGLEQAPYSTALTSNLAWALATGPNATPETGREAVSWAKRAVDFSRPEELWESLDVLATAYARAGEMPAALETISRAMRAVPEDGNPRATARLRQHLLRFQQNQPISSTD